MPGLLMALVAIHCPAAVHISESEAQRIGRRVWQNECGGTVAGLTSWNAGEDFASLGIGHFIWYPRGVRGPFEESFPAFVKFAAARGCAVPELLRGERVRACPWHSRGEFEAARDSASMQQLRTFLADTVPTQAEFLVARLERSRDKMLASVPPADRGELERQFERVAATPQGCYALVDYVNFKGEGTLVTERYRGEGWGLLQVLQAMRRDGDALNDFADAAEAVLRKRVANSPAERSEARWLNGWTHRVDSYRRPE